MKKYDNEMKLNDMKMYEMKLKEMEMNNMKMEKRASIIEFLKSKTKSKYSSLEDRLANHKPSWMYKNE